MMNLVKTLFKTKPTTPPVEKKLRSTSHDSVSQRSSNLSSSNQQTGSKRYDELAILPAQGNYGVEVEEVSFVEFDRRKKPR